MRVAGRITRTAAMAALFASAAATAAPIQWTSASGGNDHWYEFVPISTAVGTWTAARADALARTHLGLSGYLATVTSAAENAFLTNSVSTQIAWLGGSDAAVEGNWVWVDGPESGSLFSVGNVVQSGFYANWNGGEPNNVGNEDYLHMNFAVAGGWNDIPVSGSTSGYFVEYSGSSAAVPTPGVLALLGLGWIGAAAVRRRSAR